MRRLAYIAGPYAGANEAEIERNVRRACALGRWATARGYAPVVPHAIGWLGCHGARDESDPGVREAAVASGVALAETVGRAGGVLLIIIRDDGTFSAGTRAEVEAFMAAASGSLPVLVQGMTWAQWVADEGVVELGGDPAHDPHCALDTPHDGDCENLLGESLADWPRTP